MMSANGVRHTPHWLGGALLSGLVLLCALAGGNRTARIGAVARSGDPQARKQEAKVRENIGRLPLSFERNVGQAAAGVNFVARGPGYALYLSPTSAVVGMAERPDLAPQTGRKPRSRVLRMRLAGGNRLARTAGDGRLPGKANYFMGDDPSKWLRDVETFGKVRYRSVYRGVDVVYYGNQQQLEYDFVVAPGADPQQIRLAFAGADAMSVDASGDLVLKTGDGHVRQHRPVVYQEVGGQRRSVEGEYVLRGDQEVGFNVAAYDARRPLVIDPVMTYSTIVGGTNDDYGMGIAVDAVGNAYVTGYTGSFDRTENVAPNAIDSAPKYGFIPSLIGFPLVNPFFYPGRGADPDAFTFNFDLDVDGTIDTSHSGTNYDAFFFKMAPDGRTLINSTYLGGWFSEDYGTAIAIDPAGSAYVTGLTRATNFPQLQPIQSLSGGGGDAFVTKFTPAGNNLVYSTYLGGDFLDVGRSIAVDPNGNCAVTGITFSNTFPLFRAFQPTFGGGAMDQFVASINSRGTAFNFCSFVGGNGNEGGINPDQSAAPYQVRIPFAQLPAMTPTRFFFGFTSGAATRFLSDWGAGVAADAFGNVYITGATRSTDFPTTAGALKTAKPDPADEDAFAMKFNSLGAVQYSTLLGGSGADGGRAVAVDGNGSAFVTGYTGSTADFPTTTGAFQTVHGGNLDAFVSKLTPGAGALMYSTLVGGGGNDVGYSLVVSGVGRAFVAGYTQSTNFPVRNQLQGGLKGVQDGFFLKLSANGAAVDYSSYLGGNELDAATGIGIDGAGVAYVTGITWDLNRVFPSTFPTTINAFQQTSSLPVAAGFFNFNWSINGYYPIVDCFLSRFADPPDAPSNLTSVFISQTQIDLVWDDNSDNESGFEIERRAAGGNFATIASVGVNAVTYSDRTPPLIPSTTYTYRVRAVNAEGTSAYSNQHTQTTLPQAPADPSNLVVSVVDRTRLKLVWQDNANNEETYRVERRLKTTPSGTFAEIAVLGPNATTLTDTGLTPNTTYEYQVRAINSGGFSSYTNIAEGTTLPDPPTLKPTAVTATSRSASEIDLSWLYAGTDIGGGQGGFKILRAVTDPANGFTLVRQTITTATTFRDSNLLPDTVYHYRVRAYNISGDGPDSDISAAASARTRASAPVQVSGLTATLGGPLQINLSWTDLPNEAGYKVQRSTDNFATAGTLIATLGANVVAYSDGGLARNTNFYYRVSAFTRNSAGDSDGPASATARELTNVADPTVLTATAARDTQINLSWKDNNPVGPSLFQLERTPVGGATVTFTAGTGSVGGTFTHSDTNLNPNTTYSYRVRARNSLDGTTFRNGAWVGPVTATTFAPPPTAPTLVSVVAPAPPAGSTSLVLTWTDNSTTETGFLVEQAPAAGGPWSQAGAVLPANSTTATVTGLQPDTDYFFRVTATGVPINSLVSNVRSGTTLPLPPEAPDGLSITVPARPQGLTELILDWADNSDNEVEFSIERQDSANGLFNEVGVVGADVTTFTDTGLTRNTTYTYRVRASNTGGDSAYSDTASATTLPGAPGAPQNLVATVPLPDAILLQWTDASNNEEAFLVERSIDGAAFVEIGTAPANSPEFLDADLEIGKTYSYRVRARNSGGDSAYSNTASPTGPAAPSNVTLEVNSQTEITVSWVDNSDNEAGFRVERSADGGVMFAPVTTVNADVTTFTDTGLAAGGAYVYRIIAFNVGGSSAPATSQGGTTLPDPPNDPDGLTATPLGSGSIRLDWNDNSTTETGFTIERRTGTGSYEEIGGVGANTRSFTSDGLQGNTIYFFRVRAANTGGHSDYSNEASALTLPETPTGFTAGATAADRVLLRWTQNNGADGFQIERSVRGTAFLLVASVPGGSRSYTDSGLLGGVEYTYRMRALNRSGSSGDSQTVTASTPVGLAGLTIAPSNARGGTRVRGTVTLTGPAPAAGALVTLTTDSRLVSPPRSVRVPAGRTSATFTVGTRGVRTSVAATVTAELNGTLRSASITLRRR